MTSRLLTLAATSTLLCTLCAVAQSHVRPAVGEVTSPAQDLSWLRKYTAEAGSDSGGDENGMVIGDKRFRPMVAGFLHGPQLFWGHLSLADTVVNFLSVPGKAVVAQSRYITANGCVPHYCLDQGFLWIDTKSPQQMIFVAKVGMHSKTQKSAGPQAYHLWIFCSTHVDDYDVYELKLPTPFLSSLQQWLAERGPDEKPDTVDSASFVQPDGQISPIFPNDLQSTDVQQIQH